MIRRAAPLAIRAGLTLIAFLLALHGFALAHRMLHGTTGPWQQVTFRSLQLVVGKFPAELDEQPLPPSLQIARFALPLLTLWTTIGLAWRQVRNPLRVRWIARRGEHLVVAGGGELAGAVAAAERKAGRPALLWVDDPGAAWVGRAADLGVPHSAADGAEAGVERLGLERARAALLVSGDDSRNMALAFAAVGQAGRGRPAGDPLPVIARIDDIDLRATVEDRFARAGDAAAARLRVISVPDIVARRLFLEAPLDRFRRAGADARTVLLLGFGPATERYVLRTLAGAHFRDGARPRFVALDPAAAAKEAVFRARRPGADALSPVVFETAAIDQPALLGGILDDVLARHGAPVAIVVDPGDPVRALALAYACDAHCIAADTPTPPIHVRTAAAPEEQLGSAIFPYGDAASLGDPELLLQDRHDALARAIHDFYFEGRLTEGDTVGSRASMQEWEDLPETVRDDNRLVADCYRLKLHDIGARLVDGADAGFRFSGDELEELSRAEHDRWMAAKLIDGWTYAPVRDDRRRHHPDIVGYDALSERIKELDREQIRLMTRLLPRSGAAPRRVLAIHVRAADAAARGTVADALATLAARYPDRVPVLAGRFDDPASRALLIAAQDAGALVRLAMTRNAESVLGTLSGAARTAARRLARTADAIEAFADATHAETAFGEAAEHELVAAADGGVASASWQR